VSASADRGAVLVSGASTGIGRATTLRLAADGWEVHAGVRTPEDAADLATVVGVTPVQLDITDADSIADAVARVEDATGGSGLAGLFNNAGVPSSGPVEFVSLDELRRVFEVNVVGHVALTQAALPLLRRGHGRIVFTSSLSGRVALPYVAPYAASKHALEAIADSLRRELGSAVPVSIVEPGNIATPIWEKGLDPGRRAALPEAAEALYGAGLDWAQAMGERSARVAIDPDHVATAVVRALRSRHPRRRYVVGRDARVLIPLALVATGLVDRLLARAASTQGSADRTSRHREAHER
jgi:NAD(P)-dependent dehydrogenase (short-subunit alcohol dehydrogenase family)